MAVTGYFPLFGNSYSMAVNRSPVERVITRIIKKNRFRKRLMLTLNGAAAGSTATETESRVQHSTTMLGGARTIETFTYVNRATTSGDKTAGDNLLNKSSRIATPANGAGTWKL